MNDVDLSNIYPSPSGGGLNIDNTPPQNQIKPVDGVENTNNKKSKKLFFPLIVGIVILAGIIIAVIFAPKLLGSNKKEAQKTLDSINYLLPSTIDACKRVRNDVEEHALEVDLYEMEVNSCKDSVISLYELVNELNFVGDEEAQKMFGDFKTSLDVNMPNPSQLDNTLEVYTAMHNFNVALRNFSLTGKSLEYRTEEGEAFVDAINYFVDSSDNELVQFGNGVRQAYSELYDTWQRFANETSEMSEGDKVNYSKYIDAENNFRDYVENNKPNISSLYLLANDDNGEISNIFNDFMNKIR